MKNTNTEKIAIKYTNRHEIIEINIKPTHTQIYVYIRIQLFVKLRCNIRSEIWGI